MKGVTNIYNALILMSIIFSVLWTRLWKTTGIKCGIKAADCPVRQGGSWNAVGEVTLITIITIG
jgi:hypothetical protein